MSWEHAKFRELPAVSKRVVENVGIHVSVTPVVFCEHLKFVPCTWTTVFCCSDPNIHGENMKFHCQQLHHRKFEKEPMLWERSYFEMWKINLPWRLCFWRPSSHQPHPRWSISVCIIHEMSCHSYKSGKKIFVWGQCFSLVHCGKLLQTFWCHCLQILVPNFGCLVQTVAIHFIQKVLRTL